jgi:hypothetical protein
VYERRIARVARTVATAAASPIAASARLESTSCPTSATRPAIAVPACEGPPFMNARVWSRCVSGTTLTSVSHPGEATPWSQTAVTNRSTTSVKNAESTSRIPNAPAYRSGSTTTIAATPNHPNSRLVSSIETRNAAPVTPAQNNPKKPARRSASGKCSVAACAYGRYSE